MLRKNRYHCYPIVARNSQLVAVGVRRGAVAPKAVAVDIIAAHYVELWREGIQRVPERLWESLVGAAPKTVSGATRRCGTWMPVAVSKAGAGAAPTSVAA